MVIRYLLTKCSGPCYGKGKYYYFIEPDYSARYELIVCKKCNGTGKCSILKSLLRIPILIFKVSAAVIFGYGFVGKVNFSKRFKAYFGVDISWGELKKYKFCPHCGEKFKDGE